jgi:7-cyano-7-deazaguanine reductase
MPTTPSKELETFQNPTPERDYLIHMEIPEFTCICPKTGQPDFATLVLDYIPDKKCVELKASSSIYGPTVTKARSMRRYQSNSG